MAEHPLSVHTDDRQFDKGISRINTCNPVLVLLCIVSFVYL